MFPWMNPWLYAFKAPWSGDVDQNIAPVTSWFSPELEFNFAGSKAIESEVVAQVASYGKQLGMLSEAVMEIAEGKPGQSLKDLKKLMTEIDKIKDKHKEALSAKTRSMLDDLKKEDPESFNKIIKEYTE